MRWLHGITNSMGHEVEQTPGDGEGQGSLACCSPWGHKKLDTTECLNNGTLQAHIHIDPSSRKEGATLLLFKESESP